MRRSAIPRASHPVTGQCHQDIHAIDAETRQLHEVAKRDRQGHRCQPHGRPDQDQDPERDRCQPSAGPPERRGCQEQCKQNQRHSEDKAICGSGERDWAMCDGVAGHSLLPLPRTWHPPARGCDETCAMIRQREGFVN